MGLAGAEAEPFRVWVDGWTLESEGDAFMPQRLDVRTASGLNLVLSLNAVKPMVLQGNRGFSAKSDEPGNASFYYAFTRLEAAGTLERDGESLILSGTAWMDREWGTSVLGPEHAGWDWFALQLSDGTELMVYRLRRRDGARDAYDAGTWVYRDGSSEHLETSDFELEPLDFWTDEHGTQWPARWQLVLARHGLTLEIEPVLSDQLMRTTLRYWEGAVDVTGSVNGVGYMELTGYGDEP
jgi:predicted secreted hydrolase